MAQSHVQGLSTPDFIPFNAPAFLGPELSALEDAVRRRHTAADGEYTRRCEEILREETGAASCLLTTSGTAALEMAALLLGIAPGDEVVVPSFAFVSCANAFALRGALIRFSDIEEESLNIDPNFAASICGARTKAILALHYGGLPCDLDRLDALARRTGSDLLEDNAHGLFGAASGKPLGSTGRASILSFHETKNFSCGEGGALLVRDSRDVAAAKVLRDKGTNRSAFLAGTTDKYTWVGLGSSYGMSDILAAYLWVQLSAREQLQTQRRCLWERYWDGLSDWATKVGARLPPARARTESTHHIFYLLWDDQETRDAFIAHMRRAGILAVFHYQPLHLSSMGRTFGACPGDCPVSERIGSGLVRLPLFHSLGFSPQDRIIETVRAFA